MENPEYGTMRGFFGLYWYHYGNDGRGMAFSGQMGRRTQEKQRPCLPAPEHNLSDPDWITAAQRHLKQATGGLACYIDSAAVIRELGWS
jgi:hypothetical protein